MKARLVEANVLKGPSSEEIKKFKTDKFDKWAKYSSGVMTKYLELNSFRNHSQRRF
jgi:hypothetical protein